jgi:hypothetical protein
MKQFLIVALLLLCPVHVFAQDSVMTRLDKLEARMGSLESKIDKLLAQSSPQKKIVSPDDPYLITSESEMMDLQASVGRVGVAVGYTIDPWIGTYQIHFKAPAGYKGLSDGVYWFEKGKISVAQFSTSTQQPYTYQCGPNGCSVVPAYAPQGVFVSSSSWSGGGCGLLGRLKARRAGGCQ